jgi:hypothetical protein
MAWPPGKHIESVIAHAEEWLTNVRIVRHDESLNRALIDLEGQWKEYRIIVSEIHRADNRVRYAYYLLDSNNQLVHGFDNSPDIFAIKLKYGAEWKSHLHEEVPHQHDKNQNLTLTSIPMTVETFFEWVSRNLG